MDLSIVLINFNSKTLTEQAIRSIQQTTQDVAYEILVVDNSDQPGQAIAQSDSVRVIGPIENHGFGHACNVGAQKAQGRYVLFLNSDTIMHAGSLAQALVYLQDHPQVGALGIRTLLPDGRLDHGCKRGFPTPFSSLCYFTKLDRLFPHSRHIGAYRQTFLSEQEIASVDCISGSFMMMPKQVFEALGGFDEDFFMYSEDVDLCYRIKQAGYRIVYNGQLSMTHLKGQSGLYTNEKVVHYFYDSMELFYQKHYQKRYSRLTSALVSCGIHMKRSLALRKVRKGKRS